MAGLGDEGDTDAKRAGQAVPPIKGFDEAAQASQGQLYRQGSTVALGSSVKGLAGQQS